MKKEQKTIVILLGVLIPILIIAVYSFKQSQENIQISSERYSNGDKEAKDSSGKNKLADFTMLDMDGKPVKFSTFKGKVLVVNFWATWCKYCIIEIPGFNKVYEKYKNQGVEILGISMDRSGVSKVKSFSEKKIKYPVFMGNREAVSTFGSVRGLPTTFFVNRKGEVVKFRVGMIREKELEETIKSLL